MTPEAFDPLRHVWMVGPGVLDHAGPIGSRIRAVRERKVNTELPVENRRGVAIVRIDGIAMRRAEYFETIFDGFSTEHLADQVTRLAADSDVRAIVLWIDSRGGEAHGVHEAAEAIAAAAAIKPVVAQVQGVAFSAAYYLAAAASRIVAHAEDRVGSIGVIARLFDSSKMYEDAGVRPITLASGPLKSIGAPGDKVTDEQIAHVQELVDETYDRFKAFVADRRGYDQKAIDALATGALFSAESALANRLIDGVSTIEQTIDALIQETTPSGGSRSPSGDPSAMSTSTTPAAGEPTTPAAQPASAQDLKACLPGADDAFVLDCVLKEHTLDQAQSAWMEKQAATVEELRAKVDAAESGAPNVPGVDDSLVTEGGGGGGGSSESFEQLCEQLQSDRGMKRRDAILEAAHRYPAAHKAYCEAAQQA